MPPCLSGSEALRGVVVLLRIETLAGIVILLRVETLALDITLLRIRALIGIDSHIQAGILSGACTLFHVNVRLRSLF